MGLEEKPEDFGQTLATWGVNARPYVMLPLLGPSTLRDAVGFGVEVAGDPVGLAVKEYSGLSSTQRLAIPAKLGRASCRERLCQSGWTVAVAVVLKKKQVIRTTDYIS